MQLQKQCANKELSQKLWDLGIRVDSLFYWERKFWDTAKQDKPFIIKPREKVLWQRHAKDGDEYRRVPALTSSELRFILRNKQTYLDFIQWDEFQKMYRVEGGGMDTGADTDADAVTIVLIYLIEQGLVKVDDINKLS